ncbi:hypothetical protein BH20ACT4_BH20ACT4_13080 [soil metagenome]
MITRATWAAPGALVACAVAAISFLADGRGDPVASPPLDGAALFQAKGCAACHTGPDSKSPMDNLPDLSDAASWAASRQYGLTAAEYLEQSIRDPVAVISPEFRRGGGGRVAAMPTLAVTEDEIDALVAYLLGDRGDRGDQGDQKD